MLLKIQKYFAVQSEKGVSFAEKISIRLVYRKHNH